MTLNRFSVVCARGCLAAILVLCLGAASALAQAPPAARGQGPGAGRGGGGFAADPRAQVRTYHFADAKQDMQYCVFASSKVSKNTPAPLIVSLHGMGAPPTIMCNPTAVNLAEEGGYVLVAPMGYSTTGWFGSPVINMGAGRGRGGRGRGAAPGAGQEPGAPPAAATAPAAAAPAAAPAPAPAGPSDEQIAKLSEQDVMNVLDMMRKEFSIDPKRVYLTGHSMGGAGTLFLGAKHADLWAAIAPVAPASFMMNSNRAEILGKMKAAGVPILLLTGDADEVVAPSNTRMWAETLKEINANHVYIEQPGVTHGPVITTSQKEIFDFFAKHAKK
ncbi:MAG TPA: prolyl oligopeptidase family serine peptidase [Phenylobacterium sp.]|nr:prolyl oligopeptidase family serine peptidase [Phenylobacterium sp.]